MPSRRMPRYTRKRELVRVGVQLITQALITELEELIDRRSRCRRRWWIKPWITRRNELGASSTLLKEWTQESPDEFRDHLRMTKEQFGFLLERVSPHIQKQDTLFRDALPARLKTQMTLRYLATGDSFSTLSAMYRVPKNTLSTFLPEVCKSIYTVLEDYIRVPDSVDQWEKVMRDYEVMWQFPNVCGAMDGKHVNIKCPPNSGSEFFNYKKTFSTILFAVVDAQYNFLYIDVGTNGRANDAAVFSKSAFNEALRINALNIPERGLFVADDAFPLRPNILKPFSRCGVLNETQKIFNYRLSRARRVVENTFGILVSKFRIYEKPIPLALDTTEQLVKTNCALHNWLRKTSTAAAPYIQRDLLTTEDLDARRLIPGTAADIPRVGLTDIPKNTSTNHSKLASKTRQDYAERFVTSDMVPWQWDMI